MMSKQQLEGFRKLLNERLAELLNEANKTVTVMTDFDDNIPDPADRAALESDRNFELRIRDRERKLIRESTTEATEFAKCAVRRFPRPGLRLDR